MSHLKQLSQYEWFVSRTETPIESVDKFELGFPIPKYEGRWGRFEDYEIPILYHCRRRHK